MADFREANNQRAEKALARLEIETAVAARLFEEVSLLKQSAPDSTALAGALQDFFAAKGRVGDTASEVKFHIRCSEAGVDSAFEAKRIEATARVLTEYVAEEIAKHIEAAHSNANTEIGFAPEHEWNGTLLRLRQPDGEWGPWVNLRGPRGNGAGPSLLDPAAIARGLSLNGGRAANAGTALRGGTASTDFTGIPGIGGGNASTTVFAGPGFNGGGA